MRELYKISRFSLFLTVVFAYPNIAFCEVISPETENEPPSIGNFALPPSQQPGPFLSFGQSLIERINSNFMLHPLICKLETNIF